MVGTYMEIVDTVNSKKASLTAPRRHIREAEVQLRSFLTSELDGSEWSTSRSGRFTHLKELQWKEPQHPPNSRPEVSQSRSGCFGEQINQLPLPGFENRTVQPEA
jgi:hypothetical protein